jgi:acyl-CoA ligase (AMP-forming) (exosortase A-associated)
MHTNIQDFITHSAATNPYQIALTHKTQQLSYQQLAQQVDQLALGLIGANRSNYKLNSPLSLGGERVAVYLPKQLETVVSLFATSRAGGVFVPVNSLLKALQVTYILQDCQVSILITSLSRYRQLQPSIKNNQHLKRIILTDCQPEQCPKGCELWIDQLATEEKDTAKESLSAISNCQDIAAILYTSGSTGQPKGVVLSHSNLIEGAKSVAKYLANDRNDRLLAVLPLSFDYGLSQLTTAFLVGGEVVLLEYLLPRDVINAVAKFNITGLAAVPPLWIQLADMDWPLEAQQSLRYITNSGGAMPTLTTKQLQSKLPNCDIYLMYGLTEAFRSTYLDPKQLNSRPTSIGKAIPNAKLLVINQNGQECQADEPGELVHLGVHVSLGYWQNREKTELKFRPLPSQLQTQYGSELAVWSGDTVTRDQQGYLYFVGRNDDMIKSSGYRISPSELEDLVLHHPAVLEVAALGIPHRTLGHAILLVITVTPEQAFDKKGLTTQLKKQLPNFMHPHYIEIVDSLPRNPNGKINRPLLLEQHRQLAG